MADVEAAALIKTCSPLPERLGISIKTALMNDRVPEDAPFSLYGFESLSSTMDVSGGVAEAEIMYSDLTPFRVFVQDLRQGERRESGEGQSCADENTFPARSAFLALAQTKGRGRKQRTWISNESKGIYVTFFTQVPSDGVSMSGLSLAVGLAVQDFFQLFGLKTFLKWPNDVLAVLSPGGQRRKLAGILVDTHVSRRARGYRAVHIGVGLNLTKQEFPQEVPGISMEELCSEPVAYPVAVGALLTSVNRTLSLFLERGFGSFAPIWNEKSGTVGDEVEIETAQGNTRGIVLGVEADGGLRLKDASTDEVRLIYSGEIGVSESSD